MAQTSICSIAVMRTRVQRDRLADERFECSFVDLIALVQVDGTSRIALESRVEHALWILELRTLSTLTRRACDLGGLPRSVGCGTLNCLNRLRHAHQYDAAALRSNGMDIIRCGVK